MERPEFKLCRVLLEEGEQSVSHLLKEHGLNIEDIILPVSLCPLNTFICTQEVDGVHLDLNYPV